MAEELMQPDHVHVGWVWAGCSATAGIVVAFFRWLTGRAAQASVDRQTTRIDDLYARVTKAETKLAVLEERIRSCPQGSCPLRAGVMT